MVSSLNTRARLMDMQSQHHGNDPVETQGTVFMADCVRKFCLVFFSKKLSNVERVETASDCLNSIRYWRKHVHHSSSLNLKDNFITKQTWNHVSLQLHTAILLIKAHAKLCPSQRSALDKTGSDGNEIAFSEMGGFGKFTTHTRNFGVLQGQQAVGDSNLFAKWDVDDDVPLELRKKHRKCE